MKLKHFYRFTALVLSLALTASALTACGSSDTDTENSETETATGSESGTGTEETTATDASENASDAAADNEDESDTETSNANDAESSSEDVTVITAATSGSTKPYIYVDENDEVTGYDAEVLKEVFERLPQYELEFVIADFSSTFAGLTSGIYQIGVNNFSYNEERAQSYLFSYPYDEISYVFVTREGEDHVTTFADAAGLNFEGSAGVSVTNAVETWNEENPDQAININYAESDTAIQLQHVEDGTADFAIIDLAMWIAYQEEYDFDLQYDEVSEEDSQLMADNFYAYYLFALDDEELRADVNEVLKEMKEDGTLADLSEEWFGEDTSPAEDAYETTMN